MMVLNLILFLTNSLVHNIKDKIFSSPYEINQCGLIPPKITGRIVGGIVAEMEYPWFALLKEPKADFGACGGTLITSRHVLTAAHCYSMGESESFHKEQFVILINVRDICDLNPEAEIFKQHRVILHEKFNPKNVFSNARQIYDIAVIKIKGKSRNTVICLPSSAEYLPKIGQVLGFGLTEESEKNRTCEL
uniref:Putative trypsin-like serine protease n=1 Tax=Lutzomyia longipalpis TaxID=7200 RepID=A0A1B0CB22_LUTLO